MSVNIVDKSTGNLIKVAGNVNPVASSISYDNTTSHMTATNTQAAIDELKNTLNDDTTHYIGNTLLTTINTYNASWEATSNGWCVGYIYSTNDHLAIVSIDGDTIVSSGGVSNAANMVFPVCFPIKKGQTLMTRNDSATFYNIKVLSMG